MLIAFLVKCPYCDKFWHVIIGENPCYDNCPHCKREVKASVAIKVIKAE